MKRIISLGKALPEKVFPMVAIITDNQGAVIMKRNPDSKAENMGLLFLKKSQMSAISVKNPVKIDIRMRKFVFVKS
jgi:hypothetical protein